MLAYFIILFACLSGALGVSWWIACVAASLLMMHSLIAPRPEVDGSSNIEYFEDSPYRVAAGALNSATAIAAAFAMGHAIAWFWGI